MELVKVTETSKSGVGVWRSKTSWPSASLFLPALLVASAMALPLIYLIIRSLGVGVEIWDLLFRIDTARILARTLLLAFSVTGIAILLALPLAWLTVRTDLPWRSGWAVLTALPLVIPSYVGGIVVVSALGPMGMLQNLLAGPFGLDRLPQVYGFVGAMFTLALLSYPYVLLTVRAALCGLDPAMEGVSRGLGKGSWTTFLRVTLPNLRSAIAAGALLVALYTISDFGAVSMLRFDTFTRVIYEKYGSFDRNGAAVLSLVLVMLGVAILVLEGLSRGRVIYHNARRSRPQSFSTPLGIWRWPALIFCGVVVLLTLVMPLTVLSYWFLRGISMGEPLYSAWSLAINSIYISTLGVAMTVILALPVALLAVRNPGWLSGLLERITYIGYSLPGIVIALALVFFGVHYGRPIYQTFVLLIFGYVVLFMPLAVVAIRASLSQVSPAVEEAARTLGGSSVKVFRTVTLPLVLPGFFSAAALVFLATMKELPVTLILGPPGFKTLATSIWSAHEEAFFAQAAAPALLLILTASLPMAYLILRHQRGWQT